MMEEESLNMGPFLDGYLQLDDEYREMALAMLQRCLAEKEETGAQAAAF